MASQSERTPLITRRQPTTVTDSTHRRGTGSAFASANNGNGNNSVFSPSVQEFDKDDRRGCCGRIRAFLKSRKMQHQQRFNDSRYYEDTFNPFPWTCSFGTDENDGIWLNRKDQGGILMAVTVWLLIVYSGLTVTLLAEHSHLSAIISVVYCTICSLALASHAKCMFTDPGAIPSSAVPPAEVQRTISVHAMCSHCETYKPPGAHHCRICNRCISHMDHHCPWMNNCVGAGNLSKTSLILTFATKVTLITHSPLHYSCLCIQNTLSYFWYILGQDLPFPSSSLDTITFCAHRKNVPFPWYSFNWCEP